MENDDQNPPGIDKYEVQCEATLENGAPRFFSKFLPRWNDAKAALDLTSQELKELYASYQSMRFHFSHEKKCMFNIVDRINFMNERSNP